MDTSTSVELNGPSSAQINANIAMVRERIAILQNDARDLSYLAVAGDEQAVVSLAKIRAQIQQATADLDVLNGAKTVALGKEHEAAAARDEAYRARHMEIAREKAAELLKLATRADGLVAAFKACAIEMQEIEHEIHSALREADARPSVNLLGQTNLWLYAFDLITRFVKRVDHFSPGQPVADRAASAWRDLLASREDDDDE